MAISGGSEPSQSVLGSLDDHYRLLVDAVTDYAIYMLDPEGRVASWNPGAARIKGYTADEIVGTHFSKFYTPEDVAKGAPLRGLETALREGRFGKEGWRQRKDGSRFWASIIIDPIRDERGTLLGFAKITRDMTDKKNAEHDLEVAREALFQAQKMEAIGQLTGGIAHDFNNLLMAILSSLELARKRLPDDPKLVRFIDNAVQGATRGASLTQRMLAFARRQTLETRAIGMSPLVNGIKDLIRRALGPSIEVGIDIPAGLDDIIADSRQLESALLNVVINAQDAMPNGGSLYIAARGAEIAGGNDQDLPAGRYVCLSLSDTGIGMDAETLGKAKEPFFTTKGVGKGTGLGLSQVHGLLEQLDGRFILKSTLGVGTIAEFWIPAVAPSDLPATIVNAPESAPMEKMQQLRILTVDDDALVLMNTVAMLEDMGHLVRDAGSAKEALEIMRQEPPFDLIVTDLSMPQMNGLEFAQLVRADWPSLPILLATGYADLPEGRALNLPILGKPFGQGALTKAIDMVFGRPSRLQEVDA